MANLYDLKKFDLNLLVIFECIYQHLSISKAAESLYITPLLLVSHYNVYVRNLMTRYSFAQGKVSRRLQQG